MMRTMTLRRATRGKVLLAIGLLGMAVAGCGIPLDASAHALPAVQFNRTTTNSTTSTTTATSNPQKGYYVYFLLRGVLTPVLRPDPSTTSAVTPLIAIAALDNGPNEQELAQGYESALSEAPGAQVSVQGIQNGVISIALNSNFVNLLLGPTLPQAYGQIVLTLVRPQFPEVQSVQFLYDGATLAVLLPNGVIKGGPARLCDYSSIAVAQVKRLCKTTSK